MWSSSETSAAPRGNNPNNPQSPNYSDNPTNLDDPNKLMILQIIITLIFRVQSALVNEAPSLTFAYTPLWTAPEVLQVSLP
jgi:hypothetical protein